MSYNGWTNYATWCIHLWITNEEGSYNYWRSEAKDAYDNAQVDEPKEYNPPSKAKLAAYVLADRLKEDFTEGSYNLELVGFWSDLISWALSEVDWQEVAEALMEEVEDG